ncbi:uncharacterized protein LOC113492392 [Trichoplusia ni]|uniref:Uncharacterized protein LOC113492392 n=1 Tax=Trichoplusia ni TaxID=7111 RepID=A0A7E5VBK4_TRINI|nr:uncharacterized protein LOC113492392 [Trichoplusia ni]
MFRHYGTNARRIWQRCTLRRSDGSELNVCFTDLPRERMDELVDFYMKYYVPHELTHRISGIHKNKEAMDEYREILKAKFASPSTFSYICCEERGGKILPDIIGSDSITLVKRGEPFNAGIPPNLKTKETKDFFRILTDWNNLCSVPSLMERFNVESFYDDLGTTVHRDYIGYGIVYYHAALRRNICQAHGVPMAGAWVTSIGSVKATKRAGWETVYEITRENLEQVLNLKMENVPATYKYRVLRA